MGEINRLVDFYRSEGFSSFLRAHFDIGNSGLSTFEFAHPSVDYSYPETDELNVFITGMAAPFRIECFESGLGRFSGLASPGTILVSPPKSKRRVRVHVPHSVRCISFPTSMLESLGGEVRSRAMQRVHLAPEAFISSAMTTLWRELEAGHPLTSLFAESVTCAVLARMAMLGGQSQRPPKKGGLSPAALRRVVDYIEGHLSRNVSLAELARLAGLSPYHFCRAFKSETGLSPTAFLQARRIARAQDLLRMSIGTPIIEIAAAVGYESPTHFARIFRRQTGLSPRDWRRNGA